MGLQTTVDSLDACNIAFSKTFNKTNIQEARITLRANKPLLINIFINKKKQKYTKSKFRKMVSLRWQYNMLNIYSRMRHGMSMSLPLKSQDFNCYLYNNGM